jgi:hypothetical protein
MSDGNPLEGTGTSTESFREAAKKAVHDAELNHAKSRAGGDPPQRYELTFFATAKPGSSLSEYIVVAKQNP